VKFLIITILAICSGRLASAQQLDSIFFNLYTDSLKKGTYNYINVEGHFTDGSYLPLSDKELKFTSSGGKFSGNSLYIDSSFYGEKVTVKAAVIKNPHLFKEIDIYIKKYNEYERLPTMEEVMNKPSKDTSGTGSKRKKKSKRN
jgi:hypothetical protein